MRQDGAMPSRDFSLHGAIDLGAIQAANKKQQDRQAGGDANGGANPYVVDVTDQTFAVEVLDRSQRVPVLVDFWAEWCGPCKQLSPILEKLAAEDAGAWVLAKVDIDANPQLAANMQQMGVRGIPFIAVVVAGQLIPFLNGAAPEPQVRQAIDQLFATLRQEGLLPEGAEGAEGAEDGAALGEEPAARQPAADPVYAEAEQALQSGDMDGAAAAFQRILDMSPQDGNAKRGLALVELSRRVGGLDADQVLREADQSPDDVAAQTRAADVEMVSGRIEAAFERLVGTVRRTRDGERDAARKHLLQLFEVLPPDDPRLGKARRALQSVLF